VTGSRTFDLVGAWLDECNRRPTGEYHRVGVSGLHLGPGAEETFLEYLCDTGLVVITFI
jgi:hypothetical protein